MASTEVRLTEAHLGGCLALSRAANWNQNEADWRLMLGFGRGWGIEADGALAASTLVLPYGDEFAWIAMVLVLPGHRRKGYATQLLRVALDDLKKRGQTPFLDATPDGRTVYLQEGFRDCWGFARLQAASPIATGGKARAIREDDWPRVLEMDRRAFGADRSVVLRDLARRLPEAAWIADKGFLFGRDGREARQLGPLVAEDEATARELLAAALARVRPPVFLDVLDRAQGLRAWLESQGFAFQRPFTRMVHGGGSAPGDASRVALVAGPELG